MIWDFRSLIRRACGRWPRDWREINRDPIRPPGATPKQEERKTENGDAKPKADEHWLEPRWQPPPGAEDGWKK